MRFMTSETFGELRRLSTNPVGPPRTAYFASSEPFTRLVVTAGRACALTTASELLVYSLAADDEPAVEAARGDVCLGSLDDDAVLVAANGELRRLRVASLTSDLLGRATEPDARFIAGRNELLAIANDVELCVPAGRGQGAARLEPSPERDGARRALTRRSGFTCGVHRCWWCCVS